MKRRNFLKSSLMLATGTILAGQSQTLLAVEKTFKAPYKAGQKYTSELLYKMFQSPAPKYHPFVRWWWNGDKVEADELRRELRLLKDAGIGGVEINPIEFPAKDDMGKKSLKWLSDEWIDMLKVTFEEAKKLDMTCDLIVGSGWPFGSETLPREERASVMLTYAKEMESNSDFLISKFALLAEVDPGVTVKNNERTAEVVQLFLAPNPIGSLDQVIDCSDQMNNDMIRIHVPEGKYVLYALIKFESFACVINGAPGAAGSILNHMDQKAVRKYLDHMADTIEPKTGPLSNHLRAFFVDSMELEGNNWTADMAEEFRRRRGYDIMPWLPFTMFKVGRLGNVLEYKFGAEKTDAFKEQVNRVRFDFELTKAELLHERYTQTFLQWCRDKQVKSRAQTYGRGFFTQETSLDYDIPEGESWTTNYLRHKIGEEMGDEDYRRGRAYTMIDKYVSSTAHLQGKRLISAEEMTNTYLVFMTSLEFLKLGSDMTAIAGITHSIWHGFNYSPADAPFPGWIQYGSFYNERNTWWPYFKYLNEYRARLSSQLQNADMVTDIALLPANFDLWTEYGVQTDPFPDKLNVEYTSLIWEAIHKHGGGADYVSEIILKDATVKNGKLCYGVKEYGTLFLIEVTSTTPETLALLEQFVSTGGRVFCIGKVPEKSVGLLNYEARDKEIQDAVKRLQAYPDNFILLEKPTDGKYLEWYGHVMERYGLPHAITITKPNRFLQHSHFRTDDKSDLFLIANSYLHESLDTDVIFPQEITKGKTGWIYDIDSGERYKFALDNGKLHLDFGPTQTYLIVFNKERRGNDWHPLPTSGAQSQEIKNWHLTLHNPQEAEIKETNMVELKDLLDTDYKHFMGDVTYRTTIKVSQPQTPHILNLGKVWGVAELKVNGHDCGVKWFGNRIFDLSNVLVEGNNDIEVKVTTNMGNYMSSLKDNRETQRWITKRNNPLQSMGIIGPVTLYTK